MAFPAETFENLSLVPATRHSESKLEDHERNNQTQDRIDPVPTGLQKHDTAHDDHDRGKQIAEHVKQRAPGIQILSAGSPKNPGRRHVNQ